MWLKMSRLWYVKKSEVWKEDDNYNKYSQESNICKLMYALNLKDGIDKSAIHNDMGLD